MSETTPPYELPSEKNFGNVIGHNAGTATQHSHAAAPEYAALLAARDQAVAQLALAHQEIALLREHLAMKDELLQLKTDMLLLLRGPGQRPN